MDIWTRLPKVSFLLESDKWILASSSPRRIQLCRSMGWDPIIIPSKFAEDYNHSDFSSPEEYAIATAKGKVMDVYHEIISETSKVYSKIKYIVGADTVITVDGKNILEKPKDKKDALFMLKSLSGCWHQCITGVVVLEILSIGTSKLEYKIWDFYQKTDVELEVIDSEFLDAYTNYSDEFMDKAGACAYQGLLALYIKGIVGDYYNSLGFPLNTFFKWINNHFSHSQ